MITFLRIIRGICGFWFAYPIIGLLPVIVWPLHPENISEAMLIAVITKLFVIGFFGYLFFYLRFTINQLHIKKYGRPHPSIDKSKWAL
jgi:lipid-A-disaccharide synthase-like uncharacterized protein